MRVGLSLLNFETPGPPEERFEAIARTVLAAERSLVFESIWVGDHLKHVFGGPMLDPFALLGGLAARTRRLRLGPLVADVTLRHPAVIAQAALTLDVISGGRAVLGLGAGAAATEHAVHGIAFPPLRERIERLDEAAAVCRLLLSGRRSSFRGRHYTLDGAALEPPPVQPGGPPILIGGRSRGALDVAARRGDAANLTYPSLMALAERFALLDDLVAAAGRPAGSVRKTVTTAMVIGRSREESGQAAAAFRDRRHLSLERFQETVIAGEPAAARERIAALESAGVDELLVGLPAAYDPGVLELAAEVLEPWGRPRAREPSRSVEATADAGSGCPPSAGARRPRH